MKFYTIPPNKHLDLMDLGDAYFCLAHHYVKDTNYREHFLRLRNREPRVWITLDNSAAEHSLVTEQVLLDIVAELKPDEVIAPDVLFDMKQTLKNLYCFIIRMTDYNFLSHTKVFGCPQGTTQEEWLNCYESMLNNPLVSTIGLSKIAVPKCWNNVTNDKLIGLSRNECIQKLSKLNLLKKPLHLLGMGEHTEFNFYLQNKFPCIRSSDSCYTILAAINGVSFRRGDITRVPTSNEYFDYSLEDGEILLAIDNIEYLQAKYKDI